MIDADAERLIGFYRRLSTETIRMRFFTVPPDLPDDVLWREARRLASIDPQTQAALVATVEEEGEERIVGVARLARSVEDLTTGEPAIVVRDDYQREGLGAFLLDLIVQLAIASGLQRLQALTLLENVAVRHLVNRSGLPVTITSEHGEATVTIELSAT
jgi:acetyltransferase